MYKLIIVNDGDIMNFDFKGWLPVSVTLLTFVVGIGMAYGQMTAKIDSLEAAVDTFKVERTVYIDKNETKIHTTNLAVQNMQIEQGKLKLMMELLLQKEGIVLPQ
jgi:hypothetical protein